MMIFAIGVEYPLDVPVQRPHDADAREHRRAVLFRLPGSGIHRGLPLWHAVIGFRELGDVGASVFKGD
jgi:hypothetical protein